jgi:hypothetical protein
MRECLVKKAAAVNERTVPIFFMVDPFSFSAGDYSFAEPLALSNSEVGRHDVSSQCRSGCLAAGESASMDHLGRALFDVADVPFSFIAITIEGAFGQVF